MDEFVQEVRRLSALLLLAHGPAIRTNVEALTRTSGTRAVLAAFAASGADEMTTADVVAHTKSLGVARTQAFEALTQLEAGGVIERRRRGLVAIAPASRPFLPGPPRTGSATGSDKARTGLGDSHG